eukprot:GEZU01014374.1.p1 GENE.GEZU01014374.1~~GEZU01014374.1.p1  ORF type:complete len:101 (+),score=24.34 GEZU01014374.1:383-685(+)
MRLATNAVSHSDYDTPLEVMDFLHALQAGFRALPQHRDVIKKLDVMDQSVAKVERICYSIKVRGSEFPDSKFLTTSMEVDEASGGAGAGADNMGYAQEEL